MSKLPVIARTLLGLIFFVFGFAGLFNLIPPPENIPENMLSFMNGMMATKYFFPLLKGTETICGAMLLLGVFVPLSLVVLAPIVLNIFLVHVFVDTSGLPMALFIGILQVYLSFFAKPYSDIVKQIFRCPKMEAKKAAK